MSRFPTIARLGVESVKNPAETAASRLDGDEPAEEPPGWDDCRWGMRNGAGWPEIPSRGLITGRLPARTGPYRRRSRAESGRSWD